MKFSDRRKMFPWYILVLGLVSGAIGYASDRDHSSTDEHYFRHQQHYNQRIEQAVNDFKLSQSHWNGSHHRQAFLRHHHHDIQQEEPVPATSTSAPPVERHHLRHYNRHHQTWEQRVFPALRHQPSTTTTTMAPALRQDEDQQLKSRNLHDRRVNLTGAMQSRLFDRDGLYTAIKAKNGLALKLKDSPHRDDDRDHRIDTLQMRSKNSDDSDENLDEYYDDDEDSLEDEEDEIEDDDDDDDRNDDNDDQADDDEDPNDESRNRIDNDKISSKLRSNNLEDSSGVFPKAYIPGTLTRHKYETLGTFEAVKQSRRFHITNQQHHRALANAHASKMHAEATCKWPKPKVEKIQKDPSKMYVPHCTILHRCGDDTGCCNTDRKTCIAKRTQSVDLYFFVRSLGSKQGSIERHTFINHTECQCVDKSKYPHYAQSSAPAFLRRATILDCNCPRLFEKLLQENGICRCDCSSGNTGCDWLKRGMEHFSMADRKCIMEGRCKYPTCEYGSYVRKHGRCPKKEDKMEFSRSFH